MILLLSSSPRFRRSVQVCESLNLEQWWTGMFEKAIAEKPEVIFMLLQLYKTSVVLQHQQITIM